MKTTSSSPSTTSTRRRRCTRSIIPRRHIPTLNELGEADDALVGRMLRFAAAIAAEKGYADRGYRTVFNCNREAGQSVFHIHLHLLAGRGLGWPPG